MTKKKSTKTIVELDTCVVPIESLHENTWNPNRQSERAFEAEKESITEFGFIDPVTVRKHPKKKNAYEIIDGAHRVRAMRELGHEDISVNVIEASTSEAKRLTIILNETRGAPDRIDLATLLVDLRDEIGEESLLVGLPYSKDEMDGLLKLPDFDFNQFEKNETESENDEAWKTISVRVPESVFNLWEEARDKVEEMGNITPNDTTAIRNGQALEALIADWMAG